VAAVPKLKAQAGQDLLLAQRQYLMKYFSGIINRTGKTDFTSLTHSKRRGTTKISYWGKYGDGGCNQTTVTIPNPPPSPSYRFTIFFPNNVPATNCPISLSGFN